MKFASLFLLFATLSNTALNAAPPIVNGEKVRKGDPVSYSTVMLKHPDNTCTATLLSMNIALTAAHCVTDANRKMVSADEIWLQTKPNVSGESKSTQVRAYIVPNAYLHRFNEHRGRFDFAVLYFDNFFSDYHRPATYFLGNPTFEQGQEFIVAGYGTPDSTADATDEILRKKTVHYSTALDAHEFILNQPNGGVCFGDSGGPAFVKNGDELVFVGITSRIRPGGSADVCQGAAIFSNIYELKFDINEFIRDLHKEFGTPVSVQL